MLTLPHILDALAIRLDSGAPPSPSSSFRAPRHDRTHRHRRPYPFRRRPLPRRDGGGEAAADRRHDQRLRRAAGRALRLPLDLSLRRRRRRRLAGPARPRHQHPRRRAYRRTPHHRRLRPAPARRRRHRLRRERVQHRAHGQVPDQVRRRRPCTSRTRSGRSAAATGPARRSSAQEEMVDRINAAADAKTDADFVVMARTDALAVEGLEARDRPRARLRRGGRGHDLPRSHDRALDVPQVRRRGQRADARQHHRVRRRRPSSLSRSFAPPKSRSASIRSRPSAR